MDAGAPLKLRSDEEIVADIVEHLKPLKKGSGNLLALTYTAANESTGVIGRYPGPILATLQLARQNISYAGVIREMARRAKKALKVLGDDFPANATFLLKQYAARRLDKRRNLLMEFCADQAIELVKTFSSDPPVSTAFGNVHSIAQFIFEAATGEPPAGTSLLKACQKALRRLKR